MTQPVYLTVCNLLLQSHHAFKYGDEAKGMSLLVAAEQRIPDIENCLQFLNAQCHAEKIWKEHLIGSGLQKSGEFKLGNQWQVA